MQEQIDAVHANIVDLAEKQAGLKERHKFLSGGSNPEQNKAAKKKGSKRQQDEQVNITTETAAEGDKPKTEAEESQMIAASKRKKQTGMETLREADPDCTQQQLDRFYKRLLEIMNCVSV